MVLWCVQVVHCRPLIKCQRQSLKHQHEPRHEHSMTKQRTLQETITLSIMQDHFYFAQTIRSWLVWPVWVSVEVLCFHSLC